MEITVVQGDITEQQVDAVVNAANNRMRGGGGVDGAIHRAGGPAVLEDCRARFPDGLATGDAGWTTAGDMPAQWVIHVVGPNHAAGQTDRSPADVVLRPRARGRRRAGREDGRLPAGQRRRLRLAVRRRDQRRPRDAADRLDQRRGGPDGGLQRVDVRQDPSEVVDDVVDAGGQRLDVGGVDSGVHRDPQLVAPELAVGLGVHDAVRPQRRGDLRRRRCPRRSRSCRSPANGGRGPRRTAWCTPSCRPTRTARRSSPWCARPCPRDRRWRSSSPAARPSGRASRPTGVL